MHVGEEEPHALAGEGPDVGKELGANQPVGVNLDGMMKAKAVISERIYPIEIRFVVDAEHTAAKIIVLKIMAAASMFFRDKINAMPFLLLLELSRFFFQVQKNFEHPRKA